MSDVLKLEKLTDQRVIDCLKSGGVVVARTDTIYGLLALAGSEQAVARVYRLKSRSADKSPIVLVASRDQLYDTVPDNLQSVLAASWPGPVSIIVPSTKAPTWLRRGNASVAYRLPDHDQLVELISQTGPLIAPSANPEGSAPASNVEQAHDYFGERVDIYVDGGFVDGDNPSKLLRVNHQGQVERLR